MAESPRSAGGNEGFAPWRTLTWNAVVASSTKRAIARTPKPWTLENRLHAAESKEGMVDLEGSDVEGKGAVNKKRRSWDFRR